jgi:hypothetical protein
MWSEAEDEDPSDWIYPWRGIYSNNLYPQQWKIKNNLETGDVNVEFTATGGLADLFFFYGESKGDGSID